MKKILLLFILFCCCSQSRILYSVYDVEDYTSVLDSVVASGTSISPLYEVHYMPDDSIPKTVKIGTLYRNKKAVGSIQIQEINKVFNVKIIDEQ